MKALRKLRIQAELDGDSELYQALLLEAYDLTSSLACLQARVGRDAAGHVEGDHARLAVDQAAPENALLSREFPTSLGPRRNANHELATRRAGRNRVPSSGVGHAACTRVRASPTSYCVRLVSREHLVRRRSVPVRAVSDPLFPVGLKTT